MATPSSCDEPRKPDKGRAFLQRGVCRPLSLERTFERRRRIGPRQRCELGSDLDVRLINEDQGADQYGDRVTLPISALTAR